MNFFKFKSDQAATIFLTAIVTSIGSMIVAPLAIVLGFWLNDYLARPVLSIEYAELVPHLKEVEPPKKELNYLFKSSYFQSNILNGKAGEANSLATYTNLDKVSSDDMERMTKLATNYLDLIEKRKAALKECIRTLKQRSLSENQLLELVEQYSMVSGESKISFSKQDDLPGSITSKISDETKAIDATAQIIALLLKKLSHSPNVIDRLYFKLSVQNKGNTDGLVRAKGSVEFAGLNKKFPILNCLPPTKKKYKQAIAVTIADDSPEPIRSTSVGKIEKNTLSEFWYSLDLVNLENDFEKLLEPLNSSKGIRFTVHLLDHENRNISRSFPIN